MKQSFTITKKRNFLISLVMLLFSQLVSSQTTVNFNYTGSAQTWTVPVCVYSINVVVRGAKGGGSFGGNGATVTATLAVTPGQVLQINVGGTGGCPGTGFNGGGNGANASGGGNAACGGGGASDIRLTPYALGNRIVVAGGGGGMGGGDTDALGGAGGCAAGANGDSPFGVGGYGASTTAGGIGGPPWISSGNYGANGALGVGGAGATDPCYNLGPGGGGGGGFYGGGGGGSDCFDLTPLGGGGGGGGSSLIPTGGSCVQGNNSGQGFVSITYNANATPGTITANTTTICEGQTVTFTLTGQNGTIQWQSSTNGGATWTNITGATGTTYTTPALFANTCYRVAVSCGTTVYSNMICITVSPAPIATATPSAQTICSGQTTSINLTSNTGGTTFNWTVTQTNASGASAGTGNTISQTLTATGGTNGTVTYIVTPSVGSCTGAPITVTITVAPAPTITISPASAQICSGQSTNFTASGGSTYNWSGGLGTNASQTVSPTSTTTYTVTGTSTAGCTNTASVTVTVNPNPTITITPASAQICQGQSTTFLAGGASTYSWSSGLGTNASQTVSPTTTTTYTVTGTSTAGCTGTASATVTVNPNPNITITPPNPQICIGSSTTILAGGASTYNWSGGLGTNASQTVSPTTTTTYTVTGTSAAGCTGSASVTVTVASSITVNITATPPSICNGQSSTLNASGGSTYTWSGGLGTGASQTVSPATTSSYSVTGTDAFGCTGSTTVTVTVNPNPTVTITPASAQICQGQSTTLLAGGASTYNWSGGLGTNASQTVSPTSSTTYTLTGTSAQGCTGTASVTVSIHPLPTISANANPPSTCSGGAVTLTGSGGTSYLWNTGNTNSTFDVSPMATTTYTVTGSDANGCSGTASVQVTVFSALTVTVTPSTADICEGDDIVLTATSNGLNPTFDWSSGQTGSSITVSPTTSTTYEVQVNDQNGCTGSVQSSIQVNPIPHVDFIGFPLGGCTPIQVSFTNTGDNGVFLWSFGDGTTSTIANPSHYYNQSGFYTITLSVSNAGCSNSLTMTNYVHAYPVPVAAFHPSSTIISEEDASVFFNDLSIGASSWLWNFGTGDYSSEQSPEYTFTEEGQFTVWQYVENQWGCSDSISTVIWLKPIPTFYIPNAFTPNGDGVNDVFHPFGNNIDTDDYEMTIYDRWGKMVFKTTNLNTPWDGKAQYSDDTARKQGVYVFVIKLKMDGKTKIIDGTVTLIH